MKITVLKDITTIVNCFDGFGINMELDGKRTLSKPIRTILIMLSVVFWSTAIIRYTVAYLKDIDALVPVMTMDVQTLLTTTKFLVFIAQRERFLNLNEAIKRLALTGNQCEREKWNKKNDAVGAISKAYCLIAAATVGLCVLMPLMRLSYYYMQYEKLVYTLPLPGILWYDFTIPLNFALTIFVTTFFASYFVFTLGCVDCLFCWFVYNISAHLHIMRLKLENLLQLKIDDPKFPLDFAALITYHNQIISLSSELDAVFAPIIFMVVTASCLPLCFLVYQLFFLSEPATVPFFCLMISSIVTQLVIYCFGGEKVKNECDQLCEAIYMLIPWHDVPPKQRLLYLMPLIRSQRVLVLTGYFFTADRSLLVWIFKTAGSFIAVLMALRDKGERTF